MKRAPRHLWVLTSTVTLALGIAPRAAFAWKPLTHADQARQAVAALPEDDPLKAKLAANIQYVYAGSSGPDIYYALLFDPASILGDLAHYCKTDELVENMKKAAGGSPRLEALAFGWASHNVADSVAHPWVNGFVGAAFTGGGGRSLIPGTINHLHGQLEAWINRDFTGGMDQSAFELAIWLYATDPDVKSMVGQAFQDTYGDVFTNPTCGNTTFMGPLGEMEEITRKVNVEKATDKAARWMVRLWRRGAFASEPLLFGQDPSLPLRTAPEYLGLTRAYVATNWLSSTRLFNFNLDLGVDPGKQDLNDLYGPVSVPGSVRQRVFPTPGTQFVPGGLAALAPRLEAALNAKDFAGIAAVHAEMDRISQGGAATSSRFRDTFVTTDRAPSRAPFYEAADVLLLRTGFANNATAVVEQLEEPVRWVSPDLFRAGVDFVRQHPVFVIPTGGLYGLADEQQFPTILAAYVSQGGIAVVFAQQHGSDYSVLPTPTGRPIHAWGWLEDNSCYTNAAYIDTFHPMLASQSNALVTSNLDGFFDDIPENATVLLRRVKNSQPAMFMYPYGQGWVVVTSSYDDWGGFNQVGPGARAIIRDAIAWAKKPADLPVNAPGSTASITLHVKNLTDLPASQVKLILMSPSRDRVVMEQTASAAVPAGGTADVAFSHGFPADAELGIYHVDYELLDDAGVTIQPTAEEDSGRIVVAKPPSSSAYQAPDLSFSTVMPGGEDLLIGDLAVFRYRLVNRAATQRHFRIWRDINHAFLALADEVDVPGNTTIERSFTVIPGAAGGYQLNIQVYEAGGVPRPRSRWWTDVPGETGAYQLTDVKGFRVNFPRATVRVTSDRPVYAPGESATLSVMVENQSAFAWDGTLQLLPGLLAEQPLSMNPGGSVHLTVTVQAPVPPVVGYWSKLYILEAQRQGHPLATDWISLRVLEPDLRTDGLALPRWSRTSPNQVTWSLANTQPVPLTGGSVHALLASEAGTLFDETQPMVLAESPQGKASVTFTLPPLGPDVASGSLTLTADNGFGKRIQASAVMKSALFVAAPFDGREYSAGESGEIAVTLENTGTIVEEGIAGGSIDGVGSLTSSPYTLLPGQSAVVRLGFTVPADVIGGMHQAEIVASHAFGTRTSVAIKKPIFTMVVEDRLYQIGEEIPVTLRNAGGSRATPLITLSFPPAPPKTASLSLDPGAEGTVALMVPRQIAAGVYLAVEARDEVSDVRFFEARPVRVAGTAALLQVQTDQPVYVAGATIQASAQVTNSGVALDGGLLHLEIATPCVPPLAGRTYHFETWDGTRWVERAARERAAFFQTDQVDLGPYLPDPDGEYKVRIRQAAVSPAFLDYVTLVSSGSLVPAQEATLEGGGDVLPQLRAADDDGLPIDGQAVVVRFPPALDPTLVYRAREGLSTCFPFLLWQKDVPLNLDAGAVLNEADAVTASPSHTGQFVFSGTVITRDGQKLAEDSRTFEIVSSGLAVSVRSDAPLYRRGTRMTISGTLRNLSAVDEPSLAFDVFARGASSDQVIHEEALALAVGESRDYTFEVDAFFGQDGEDLALGAEVFSSSSGAVAQSEWPFKVGTPSVSARLQIPDPAVHLVPTSPRLVAAEEGELDAVTKSDMGALDGPLPFPVVLGGVGYTAFHQSVDGFVELVPDGGIPRGAVAACLDGFGDAAVVAGFLGDLDASFSGFVGYKHYGPGSQDRAGRVFPTDTIVFFWDAPAKGETAPNSFQVLITQDGLLRIDAGPAFLPTTCARTGITLPLLGAFPYGGPAPFGLRAETGLGRGPFSGSVKLRNDGTFPGAVTLDSGRVGGSRTTTTVTVGIGESRSVPFEDTAAGGGTYSVVSTGDADVTLVQDLQTSQGLRARYTGDTKLVPGATALPVTLAATGGVAGPVTVTFTLTGPSGAETVARTYELDPGFVTRDAIPFTVPEGALTLAGAADGVAFSMDPVSLLAGPGERVTFTAVAGTVTGGTLPISLDAANTGLSDFSGEIRVDGVAASRTPLAIPFGQSLHLDLSVSLAGLGAGPQALTVQLVSASGVVLSETPIQVNVVGPRVVLAESPAGASFDAAATASLRFVLENRGDEQATGSFRFQVFDQDRTSGVDIAPGARQEIVFDIYIDNDAETKVYPGRYTVSTSGMADTTGQINFNVNGISLSVQASLDKPAYRDGDTAHFTVEISNGRPQAGTDYLVRVHYSGFEEVQPVAISGTTTEVFDIPLPQVTGEPVFLGISTPDAGRSAYINTFNLRRADDAVVVTLDQQVYGPGATVTVSATPVSPGTLSLSAPGFSETIALTGAVTRSFALPADLPGGTYSVAWSFAPASGSGASGSVPFDVAGLRVRVFEARLDQGRYGTGETIVSTLRIHTNETTAAALRGFIVDPEGVSTPLGEATVALDPETDLVTTNSWPFASNIAGLHRFVYGIYQPGGDTLLASGSLAFDVGNAALLGLRTDKADYPTITEPVQVSVSAFVSAPATLRLEVDGQAGPSTDLTQTGIVEVPLTIQSVSPGPHQLAAVAEGGGYTSRRTTSFNYGTSLPDLVAGIPFARPVAGGAWKIDVTVSNVGRSGAPATDLLALDVATGASLGSVAVPALSAGGSAVTSVDWNVLGAAGSHEVEVVVDPSNAIQEFRKDNNRARAVLEVPSLLIQAIAAASYPANVQAGLGASVTNLTSDHTYAGLAVTAIVTAPDRSVILLPGAALTPLAPASTVAASTPWAVGRAIPGAYVLTVALQDGTGSVLSSSTVSFSILPTVALTGTVSASPNPAEPQGAVTFSGHVENQGNVAVTGTATFELVAPDSTIGARYLTPVTIPLGGSADFSLPVSALAAPPGDYRLELRVEVGTDEFLVATSTFSVLNALRATLGTDLTPRVLVYLPREERDEHDEDGVNRAAFVQHSLQGTGAFLKVTSSHEELERELRSGVWNTHVLMGKEPVSADELREAVFRGDGLVVVQWQGTSKAELDEALGARIQGGLPGENHTLAILDGPLGPAQTLALHAQAAKLQVQGATRAGIADQSVPILCVHPFGQGRTVAMAFDPAVASGDPSRSALEALFARSVAYAAPHVARAPAAGTVVPLALVLNNPGTEPRGVTVTIALPFGVSIASVEDRPTQSGSLDWAVTVTGGASLGLRFQVLLPDVVGHYELTSTVKVAGVSIGSSPSLVLEVTRTVEGALGDAIAVLEATDVAPEDHGHLQSAIAHLQTAQGTGEDTPGLEARIRLAMEADEELAGIQSADLGPVRAAVDRVVAAWERMWFELVGEEQTRERRIGKRDRLASWALLGSCEVHPFQKVDPSAGFPARFTFRGPGALPGRLPSGLNVARFADQETLPASCPALGFR